MRKTVIVKGPAFSRSGYGEQTRFALRALRSREDLFDIYLINIPWGQTGWITADDEERAWLEHLIHKTIHFHQQGARCMVSLQVTIPNEWEKMCPINIGFTAGIETSKVSPQWIGSAQVMDTILVVSNHAKQVYEATTYQVQNEQTGEVIPQFRCETPIKVTNYPVRTYEPQPMDIDFSTDFNFLAVAQWGIRKNMNNTVKWFIEEFHDEEVGMVLKTNLANDSTKDHHFTREKLKSEILSHYPDRKCKIYLLHGTLEDTEMTWLYQHPKIKALASLTHGEGFGLPLFEAAYNGLPIICPLWSGQTDFLFVKNKKGKLRPGVAKVDYTLQPIPKEAVWEGVVVEDSMWCYGNENSYKQQLRGMYKTHQRFKASANKLKARVLREFAEDKMFDNFCSSFWQPEWGTMEVPELETEVRSFD